MAVDSVAMLRPNGELPACMQGSAAGQEAADTLNSLLGPAFHIGVEFSRNYVMLDAAAHGKLYLVQLLLAVGATVDARDVLGRTAFMLAIEGRHRDTAHALRNAGADINARDFNQSTPLMYAARADDSTMIFALRRAGVDVDTRNCFGNTALIYAAEQNNLLALQALLERNVQGSVMANANAWNKDGQSALCFALLSRLQFGLQAQSEDNNTSDLLHRSSVLHELREKIRLNTTIIAALFDAGVDVNARDIDGNTILIYAVVSHDLPLIGLLLAAGADPGLRNHEGKHAIDYMQEHRMS